jgi:hypothetical protein
MSSKSEAYEHGRDDGKDASPLDEFAQHLIGEALSITDEDHAYDRGFSDQTSGRNPK